ncbi:DUF305 domain-containing protein [Hymenobacter algoricola]|uniref:DUF305 domain-containing protein n=1 Tax=Hymenobacter algoricola TaxID=486267 RepID=A0ABP7NNR3_9BACT
MKKLVFFLAVLGSATGLLTACNGDPAAGSTATTEPAGGDVAGMNHSRTNPAPGAGGLMNVRSTMLQDMEAVKPTGNADSDFAHVMMAHHRGAVALSALELRHGQDAGLRALARKISTDQKKELQALKASAARLNGAPATSPSAAAPDPFTSLMKSSLERMMNLGLPGGSIDADYALLMVAHHQSAIDLAKAELAYGRDAKLREMAQQLIDTRQNELQQFEQWPASSASKPTARPAG